MTERYKAMLERESQERLARERMNNDQETRANVREFEDDYKKKIEKEIEDFKKKRDAEMEAMRKRTEQTRKEIKEKESADSEKLKKAMRELEESSEKELARICKEYDEIIGKRMMELKIGQLQIENDLIDNDAERRKVADEFHDTRLQEMEKKSQLKDKLTEEQQEKDKERAAQVLAKELESLEVKRTNLKNTAAKMEENSNKEVGLQSELQQANLQVQASNFETLVLRTDQRKIKGLNDSVEELKSLGRKAQERYANCLRYFRDKLADNDYTRALRSFEELEEAVRAISQNLIGMNRKLADVDESDEKKKIVDRIREINRKTFSIGTCVAGFIGRFQSKSSERVAAEEEKLGTSMLELSELINMFENFKSGDAPLMAHIQKAVEDAKK